METLQREFRARCGMTIRQALLQFLSLATVLSTAFMGYKVLSMATDSESPVVVVLSGSMEPAFWRGDMLLLDNRQPAVVETPSAEPWEAVLHGVRANIGDIVVYNLHGHKIPIVHRIVKAYSHGGSAMRILTKGDNNRVDDVDLYGRHQDYLDRGADVVGIVRGYIPYVGYLTIQLNDFPWLKYTLLAVMGAYILIVGE